MRLLLTDRLSCPRCGPAFGLILLADRLVERRVLEGTLGCPNCRDSFSVRGGFADLRAPPRGELGSGSAGTDPGFVLGGAQRDPADRAEAERVTALLGIPRGPGTVALVGRPARWAVDVVEAVGELDAVAVDADTARWEDHEAVSRMVSGPGLPFFSGVLRGVVVEGGLGDAMLFDAARVTARAGRTVVVGAPAHAGEVLREAGLAVLAEEAGTVVAARG